MSGVLRLGNTGAGTGRSTLIAAASNDQTFTLPSAGGTLLTSNTSIPGGTITLDGATINITNGDLNVDSGTLFVDEANNRVGIGTTSPSAKLHVEGDILLANGSDLYFATSSNPAPRISNSEQQNSLSLFTNATESVRITDTGRVGIGTGTPSTSVHISGGTDLSRITLESSAANAQSFVLGQGITGIMNAGFEIRSIDESITRFCINNIGNVGIGTTSPSEIITGRGNILLETNSTAADSGAGLFWHSTTNSWTSTQAHAAIYGKRVDGSNGYLRFDTRSGGTTAERARIDSSGRLLVGKTSAGSTLTNTIELAAAGTSINQPAYQVYAYPGTNNASTGYFQFFRSGSATLGTNTLVSNNNRL